MDLISGVILWYLSLGVVLIYHVQVDGVSVWIAVAIKLLLTLLWGPLILAYWTIPTFRRWANE